MTILAPTSTASRAPRITDPALAFDIRQDARDARKLACLQAEGYTHSRCNRCQKVRVLSWNGGDCNEYDSSADDSICPGTYRAIRGAM